MQHSARVAPRWPPASGLYGMLIPGDHQRVSSRALMVGRTPGIPRQKRSPRVRSSWARKRIFLITPLIALTGNRRGDGAAPASGQGMLNTGPHGLSEVLLTPFTFGGQTNNGSAFAGITPFNTEW